MQNTKRFWRGLFFIFLITALCGGMALPALSLPARAAPRMQAATDVVISEFRFRGSAGATDEFIEIYNPTTSPVNLNGWQIRGSNNSGGSANRYTFSTSVMLQPGQHFLIANTDYDDSVAADATYGTGISDDGGVALVRPDNSIADQA
jgi:predicted extracellular nuclease